MHKAEIAGNVVVITGASSGIGAATARLLAGRGARVVLAARRAERLEQLKAELEQAGGQALAVPTDVRDRQACEALIQRTLEHWGRVDVLINNAGLGYRGLVGALEPAQVQEQLDVNLLGVIWCSNAAVPAMRRQRGGQIINVGSVAGTIGLPESAIYCATKFGLDGFSQALRAELRADGIAVSLLCPGFVETEFKYRSRRNRPTLRRPGPVMQADDVAGWIVRLIERPRRKVIISWPYHLISGTNRLFPGLSGWLVGKLAGRALRTRGQA